MGKCQGGWILLLPTVYEMEHVEHTCMWREGGASYVCKWEGRACKEEEAWSPNLTLNNTDLIRSKKSKWMTVNLKKTPLHPPPWLILRHAYAFKFRLSSIIDLERNWRPWLLMQEGTWLVCCNIKEEYSKLFVNRHNTTNSFLGNCAILQE